MHEHTRQTPRVITGAALSALVMVALATPASAHGSHGADTPSDGLVHQLTQWDHLAVLVVVAFVAAVVVATLRGTRNQAD